MSSAVDDVTFPCREWECVGFTCKSFDNMFYSIDHRKCWNISELTHASIWMINLKGMTIYRPQPLLTWQHVNFPKSLNREGIIYPSVLSKHSSVLICGGAEKQSEMCHSVVKVINNVNLFCLNSWVLFSVCNRIKGFGFWQHYFVVVHRDLNVFVALFVCWLFILKLI